MIHNFYLSVADDAVGHSDVDVGVCMCTLLYIVYVNACTAVC